MKHRFRIGLALVVALALLVVAHFASGQRPQLVYQSSQWQDIFWVSPQARWMLCDQKSGEKVLIDLRSNQRHNFPHQGQFLRYAPDENAVLIGSPSAIALHTLPDGKRQQSFALPVGFEVSDVHLSADGVLTAVNQTAITRWNAGTGALMESHSYNPNYKPLWGCGTRTNFYFSSASVSDFCLLARDGTWVRSGNDYFSMADGQPMAAPDKSALYPHPRPDVDAQTDGKRLRISDKSSGQTLFSEVSVQHKFTADGHWLLNRTDERHVQLVNARSWKVTTERAFAPTYDWEWNGAPDFLLTVDNGGHVWRWNLG